MRRFQYIFKYFVLLCLFFGATNLQAQGNCVGAGGSVDWWIFDNVFYESQDMSALYHLPNFPNAPSDIKTLTELATTSNYKNNYGSLIEGFILAPETGTYTFNITGDDYCRFYLSTTNDPSNLALVCEVPGYSGTVEHNKFPEQTSVSINLVAGQFYSFRAQHIEAYGGDYLGIHWRLPSAPAADWVVVHGTHLYKNTCITPCPVSGAACDDGDASTINDLADGDCNCVGMPTTAPACAGEHGSVLAMYYDNITGYSVGELYAAPNYPDSPDRGELMSNLYLYPDWNSPIENFGTRIQYYLQAPHTGDYIFNITGGNQVSLKLSTDTDPANASQIGTTWWSGFTSHWEDPNTTSPPITLQAGQFYYMEVTHKNGEGGHFHNVSWKTPMQADTSYQYLNLAYVYQYGCETACMPLGLTCDDGDSTTFDDAFDANCACAGTPCIDGACTNALDYTPLDMCAPTDNHSTYPDDSWMSCQTSPSPNTARGNSHWIEYDLGQTYLIDDAQVWNYNVSGATQQGFQNVLIDYSQDGINWTELGTYTWAQAPGTATYEGFNMASFAGIAARKILITAVDNFEASNCMGISEVRFTASTCPVAGTTCDDGIPSTFNDVYDAFCNCAGEALVVNDCTDPILFVNDMPIVSDNYDAITSVFSTGLVPNGAVVSFVAGGSVTMDAGFEVQLGADFLADIIPCGNAKNPDNPSLQLDQSEDWLVLQTTEENEQVLTYNVAADGATQLDIFTLSGEKVLSLLDKNIQKGTYEKTIQTPSLDGGIYMLVLKTGNTQVSERMVVMQKR